MMYAKCDLDTFIKEWMPAQYRAICYVVPTAKSGLSDPLLFSVGNSNTLEGAMKLIEEDRKSCANTFSGLMSPVATDNRHYRIFKATWETVSEHHGG